MFVYVSVAVAGRSIGFLFVALRSFYSSCCVASWRALIAQLAVRALAEAR